MLRPAIFLSLPFLSATAFAKHAKVKLTDASAYNRTVFPPNAVSCNPSNLTLSKTSNIQKANSALVNDSKDKLAFTPGCTELVCSSSTSIILCNDSPNNGPELVFSRVGESVNSLVSNCNDTEKKASGTAKIIEDDAKEDTSMYTVIVTETDCGDEW